MSDVVIVGGGPAGLADVGRATVLSGVSMVLSLAAGVLWFAVSPVRPVESAAVRGGTADD
ncbi:hypothetical protein BRC81_17335 [Halobacteriales archaeon QS_1_68_20]|nr:MAG: hypothetical protein BRC81_17335 [Halobacteriales archaeon QS_1_68_20]